MNAPSCTCGRARVGRFRPGDCAACWHRFNPQDAAAPTSPPPACRFDGGPVTVSILHTCTKQLIPVQRIACTHPDGARREAHATPSKYFCRRCPDREPGPVPVSAAPATQGAQP